MYIVGIVTYKWLLYDLEQIEPLTYSIQRAGSGAGIRKEVLSVQTKQKQNKNKTKKQNKKSFLWPKMQNKPFFSFK